MALGDEAVGAHLREGWRRNGRRALSQVPLEAASAVLGVGPFVPASLEVGAQAPEAPTPTPTPPRGARSQPRGCPELGRPAMPQSLTLSQS